MNDTYILFEIAGTTYGIPSQNVRQIEMIEHITPLPNAPKFVEGVVFTRGEVIPAVNLRRRFGFEAVPHNTRSRLIVTSHKGRVVGLIADSAREFMNIGSEAIQPMPETMEGISGRYLNGIVTVGERIVLIVKLDELVTAGNPEVPVVQA